MKPAHVLLATFFVAASLPAAAQVYKCKTPSGGTLVSDQPCDGANKPVKVQRSEPVTLEQQIQAAEVQQRRRVQLEQIQAEDAAHRARLEARQNERAIDDERRSEQAARAQAMEKQRECAELAQQRVLSSSQKTTLRNECGEPSRKRSAPPSAPLMDSPPPPPPKGPGIITNCDGAGCWDTNGQRYNSAAGGNFHRQDGRFCQQMGNLMQCN